MDKHVLESKVGDWYTEQISAGKVLETKKVNQLIGTSVDPHNQNDCILNTGLSSRKLDRYLQSKGDKPIESYRNGAYLKKMSATMARLRNKVYKDHVVTVDHVVNTDFVVSNLAGISARTGKTPTAGGLRGMESP